MTGVYDRSEQDVWYPIRASALRISIEARALDRRSLDAMNPSEHLAELLSIARHSLLLSTELLDHVVSTCGLTSGRRPGTGLPFELGLDAAVRAGFDVGDLADFIRVEFRRRLASLNAASGLPTLAALAECDRAVAGVSKALAALDLAAARASSTPFLREFVFELDRSLRIRRKYAEVSERIALALAEDRVALTSGLGLVTAAIDELLESELYQELRVGDRLLLRSTRRRLVDWSRLAEEDPLDPQAASEAREELRLVVAMLARVNSRRELVEHDSRLLFERLERPGAGPSSVEADVAPVSSLGPTSSTRSVRGRASDEEPTARLPPGQARHVLDEYLISHCSAWLDEGLAALGGRTPRVAAQTSPSREAVEELISDMERQFGAEKASEVYAFQWLRLELGFLPRAR